MNEAIARQAAVLGLDPRGYRVVPDADDYAAAGEDEFALPDEWVPWDAPASRLTGDPGDDQPVLDYLTDQAGAQGMYLTEYLGLDDDPDCE